MPLTSMLGARRMSHTLLGPEPGSPRQIRPLANLHETTPLTLSRYFFVSRPEAFRRAIDESNALTPHQLRSWTHGSYAAWPLLRAPKPLGPLHLEGTAEIPSALYPRKVRSFAPCTYVQQAGIARRQ